MPFRCRWAFPGEEKHFLDLLQSVLKGMVLNEISHPQSQTTTNRCCQGKLHLTPFVYVGTHLSGN
jgi:hypothetical protein